MRVLPILLVGICVALDARAAEPAEPPIVTVTIVDQGKIVELKPGQKLQVTLDSNRTTGFSWSLESIDAKILQQAGEPVYLPESKHEVVGGKGTESWLFTAIAPGEQPMRFLYRRPFEPNISPARTFAFTVRIKS
jgi:inhibitor of cysteine peptidase